MNQMTQRQLNLLQALAGFDFGASATHGNWSYQGGYPQIFTHTTGWMIEVIPTQSTRTNQGYMRRKGDYSTWSKVEPGSVMRHGFSVRPDVAKHMDWVDEKGTDQHNRPLRGY